MKADLQKVLGVPVEEFMASDYNAVIEAMRTNKVDMAYFGPLSFALANEHAGAEPIGMKAKDGTREYAFYKSVLIVKHDSTIASIQDIKGKSMAFVDPSSTSGNLVPSNEIIKAFPDAHLTMEDLHTNGKFFSAITFSGKHQAGLQAVIKGDVDVVPISDEILKAKIRNNNATDSAVKIIFASAPIFAEPMAMRGSLPQAIKDKVKSFILTYQNDKYFEDVVGTKGARFIPCTLTDYQSIIDLNHSMNK